MFFIISMYLYSTRLSTRIVGFLAREDKRCCANRQVSKWTSGSKLSTAIYPQDHLRIMKTVTVGIPTSVLSIYFTSKTWRCTYTGCNKYIWLMLKLFFNEISMKNLFLHFKMGKSTLWIDRMCLMNCFSGHYSHYFALLRF